MAGFVTLLTSVLILKGADVGRVVPPFNYVVVALLAVGAVLSVGGLWSALRAEAPSIAVVDYEQTLAKYGSIAAFERRVDRASVSALKSARRQVLVALALLISGTVLWWLSPTASTETTFVRVTWNDSGRSATTCGQPDSAPDGVVEVTAAGAETPTGIRLDLIEAIAFVRSC